MVCRRLLDICTAVSSEEYQFCSGLGGFQALPAKKRKSQLLQLILRLCSLEDQVTYWRLEDEFCQLFIEQTSLEISTKKGFREITDIQTVCVLLGNGA